MKKFSVIVVISAILQIAMIGYVFAGNNFRVSADPLAALELPIPENAVDKTYLGLTGTGNFRLPRVRAQVLLIEIFSMYCPICQAEAPVVNELFQLIEGNPDTRSKVKLIGIGAGNTPFEVDVFRKKYGVKFPMFADDNMLIRKAASEDIRTPTFVALKIEAGKIVSVLPAHVGQIKDANAFLKALFPDNSPN